MYILDISRRVSNLFLIVIVKWLYVSLLTSEDQSYRDGLLVCFLFLWLEDTPSEKEYLSQFKVFFVYFFFIDI